MQQAAYIISRFGRGLAPVLYSERVLFQLMDVTGKAFRRFGCHGATNWLARACLRSSRRSGNQRQYPCVQCL
jgi:hypothetical protein